MKDNVKEVFDSNGKRKDTKLFVQGNATDHIWAMAEAEDGETNPATAKPAHIGLRFDCGDSGTLYLTRNQAHDVIDTLNDMLQQLGTP